MAKRSKMDKIIDLRSAKNKKALAEKYFKSDEIALNQSIDEALKNKFITATIEISSKWKEHAVRNAIDDLIIVEMSDHLIDKSLKYSDDLNAISYIEKKLNLNPLVLGPGASSGNHLGWGAGFFLNGILYATPEFSTEAYARCFNILLWRAMRKPKKPKTD